MVSVCNAPKPIVNHAMQTIWVLVTAASPNSTSRMMELVVLVQHNAQLAFPLQDVHLALPASQRKKTLLPLLMDLSVWRATLLAKLA